MPDPASIAINSEALFNKSKVFISRAIARKKQDDLEEYQLWASLALELLGKSALAAVHPCLIVDPTHWKSMFVAAGIKITTDIKTISAKTLYEWLNHLIPRFDTQMAQFCLGIAERRNAELHSGDLPFREMRLEAWEARFWHACDVILRYRGHSLDHWLGAADAKAPSHVIEEAAKARRSAVQARVSEARERHQTRKAAERRELERRADAERSLLSASLLRKGYDRTWFAKCPACGEDGVIAGTQIGEDFLEVRDVATNDVWELVQKNFAAEQFICPVCGLSFEGAEELESAGIPLEHAEEEERELEYEPEYMNE